MPGNDSYTKLLLHCNGTDEDTSFTDDSASAHSVTSNNGAVTDTAQYKFGVSSGRFTNGFYAPYLSIPGSSDFSFTGDFTIDFWVRFSNYTGDRELFIIDTTSVFRILKSSDDKLYFNANSGGISISSSALSWNNGQWYHIAVVRNGSSIDIYRDGTSVANGSSSSTVGSSSNEVRIGGNNSGFSACDGWMDEIRVSNGIARWTTTFTPSTEEYDSFTTPEAVVDETITLSDNFELLQNPNPLDINETISLSDQWDIILSMEPLDINEILYLSDLDESDTDPRQFDINEGVSLSENWSINIFGTFHSQYATKLYTSLQITKAYLTRLNVALFSFAKYATKLYTQFLQDKKYSTDLRVAYFTDYNAIPIGTLEDFVVKLDGVTLTDVDYNTLNISLNLNTTPSQATFTLARRHDDLDKKLDGSTSIITAENKIEVYDGTYKLFTGYISEIDADSTTDTVKITAEDIRRKLSSQSMELRYGGEWQRDSNTDGIPDADDPDTTIDDYHTYIRFEKNIETALNEVYSAIGGQISGYDSLPFSGSFVPEYVKSYNDYVSLIDELVRQTANCNWYIDENERIRFQPIGIGEIKNLNLAPLNAKRHPYDLVINDVHLNKTPIEYAQSYNVKLGKNIDQIFYRTAFIGDLSGLEEFLKGLDEKTIFCYQRWGIVANWFYVGIDQTIYGYSNEDGYVLQMMKIVQYSPSSSLKRGNVNVPDVIVGAGLPKKTIFLESYGIKTCDSEYSEEMRDEGGDQVPWFVIKKDEEYDRVEFATDLANFELSQNNKKITTANASMLLDAYKYYNLSFKDLINFTNTIQVGIYKDNNGFPLNISGIQIDCSKRTVSLSLTNYGKSWYAKSKNYMTNWSAPTFSWILPKVPVQQFSGL